jgi:hypothetical protein
MSRGAAGKNWEALKTNRNFCDMTRHLSFCEKKDNWPAGAIANRVQLGVYPADYTPVVHARNATRA